MFLHSIDSISITEYAVMHNFSKIVIVPVTFIKIIPGSAIRILLNVLWKVDMHMLSFESPGDNFKLIKS
uniref:Uncharacterized protein n=1 Tax=Macaca nemestrina TaxID=9545 RepID=A0A2K6ASI2_MACNE